MISTGTFSDDFKRSDHRARIPTAEIIEGSAILDAGFDGLHCPCCSTGAASDLAAPDHLVLALIEERGLSERADT